MNTNYRNKICDLFEIFGPEKNHQDLYESRKNNYSKKYIPLLKIVLFCAISAFMIGERNLANFLANDFDLNSKMHIYT